MRKNLILAAVPVAVVGVALAVIAVKHVSKPVDQFAQDLQKAQAIGLDLAQAQGSSKYALTETNAQSKPAPAAVNKSGAGSKAIHSNAPTVKAAPEEVSSTVVEDLPQVQVSSVTPGTSTVDLPVPVVARPVPVVFNPTSNDGGVLRGGEGRTGAGTGPVWGGVVIRGGGVDGDNCDPRPNTGRSGPVFSPGVGVSTSGGMRPGLPGGATTGGGVVARPRGH